MRKLTTDWLVAISAGHVRLDFCNLLPCAAVAASKTRVYDCVTFLYRFDHIKTRFILNLVVIFLVCTDKYLHIEWNDGLICLVHYENNYFIVKCCFSRSGNFYSVTSFRFYISTINLAPTRCQYLSVRLFFFDLFKNISCNVLSIKCVNQSDSIRFSKSL